MSFAVRPLPEETVNGLRPPLPGYPFFAHADRFRFQPNVQTYWPVNAWWLADASFLVYGSADFIEAAVTNSPLPEQAPIYYATLLWNSLLDSIAKP